MGENGYEVSSRTLISKNKYAKDFQNTKEGNSGSLTSAFNNADVVVTDASQLNTLSNHEVSTLQSRVKNNQTGLVITATGAAARSFYSGLFGVTKIGGNVQQQIQLRTADTSSLMAPLTIDQPMYINASNTTQPLKKDKQDRVHASVGLYGLGKLVFTTISNSFSWKLSGNEKDYSAFWTTLINAASPTKEADETWSVYPSFPTVNEPATIVISTQNKLPKINVSVASVPLIQNTFLPGTWSGLYWPTASGWQAGITPNGKINYWYAYAKKDWQFVKASERLNANKTLAASQKEFSSNPISKSQKTEVPKIYFYILLLIACGYLWLESKFQ